jgi:hypothetical protein
VKEDEKDTQVTEEAPTVEETSEDQVVENAETAEVPQERPGNGLAEKRGRMIVAGMLVAIIVSVIVVVVAGVFQLTYRGMIVCPKELPVNDPAKVLWQEIVAQQDTRKSLGVPETLLSETKLKGPSPVTTER